MNKYNPIIEDETYWKYQDLIESWSDFIQDSMNIKTPEEFRNALAFLIKKVYDMGFQDACKELNSLEELDENGKVFN